MNSFVKSCVIVSLVFVTGCVPFWRKWMPRSNAPTPATYSVLQKHEDWCYDTVGEVECYPGPQRGIPPESLVNVNPPSRYPLTRADYNRALAEYEAQKK